MFKKLIKDIHNLEDLLVECAELCNITSGISRLIMNQNEAYLKEKKAEKESAIADITDCEMFRYLSAT